MKEVEVIYLKDGHYAGRKYENYPDDEAEEMYMKCCAKYRDGGALVILRKQGEVLKTFLKL